MRGFGHKGIDGICAAVAETNWVGGYSPCSKYNALVFHKGFIKQSWRQVFTCRQFMRFNAGRRIRAFLCQPSCYDITGEQDILI